MNANTTITLDRQRGTCTINIEPLGETELDHELLEEFFQKRTVVLMPMHQGDRLSARIVIADADAFSRAIHDLENRKRAVDGRPSLEQEAEAKAQAAKVAAARGQTTE